MKAIVYVDGYNFYYGCLKHSTDKWLDIYKLFSQFILKAQCPQITDIIIKFFTAPIHAKVATHGQQAQIAQQNYQRALTTLYPQQVQIISGYYSLEKAKLLAYKQPPDKNDRLEVWKLEEKQTDVNIALTAYRDAIKGLVDILVFVSNDTDLEPALSAIRQDMGQTIQIGIVIPLRQPEPHKPKRPPNQRLSKYANWTRDYLTHDELANSHLPLKIPTSKKTIFKPDYW